MSIREQLRAIHDQHGQLTPALVVDEARQAHHPLHDRFEWDDSIAGESWRREQAHDLIRSVRIVYREADDKSPERSIRAFHAVRNEKGYVYEPADMVAADPLLAKIVLADMQREWHALKRRYEQFDEFRLMVRRDIDGAVA